MCPQLDCPSRQVTRITLVPSFQLRMAKHCLQGRRIGREAQHGRQCALAAQEATRTLGDKKEKKKKERANFPGC